MDKPKCCIAGLQCCETCKHKTENSCGQFCKECLSIQCKIFYKDASCDMCKWERDLEKFPIMTEWISVEERLPEPETEVLICATNRLGQKIITTAMYEDGTVSIEDSTWNWQELDFIYDEERDLYLVPEGWWEYRHYNPDEIFNNAVDNVVTHWMQLPELPEE